ncbi:MAG: hypothetical protein VKJ04_02820 [Vampirovibrionales bacterium]|nr:hypothetical protein [Vampirovibrionales bacterium]
MNHPVQNRAAKAKGVFSTPFWWFLFALDTVILSWCFQAFKHFTLYPTLVPGLGFMGTLLLFLLCTLCLVFDSYVKERAQGKVKHPIAIFERLATR